MRSILSTRITLLSGTPVLGAPLLCSLALGAVVLGGCGDGGKGDTAATTKTPMTDSADETAGQSETGGQTTGGAESTSGGIANPTTGEPETTTEGVGSTGGGESSTGCAFICMTTGEMMGNECDNWAQDCPDGQKCMPWANNGGNAWNATKCVDVKPNPGQPGDVCMVEGSGVSGIDDCDLGVMCWEVDPATQTGTCVAQCKGTPEAPKCDGGGSCFVSNMAVLNLCLPLCDPLAQDCAGTSLCIPNPNNQEEFTCVLDASGDNGKAFDPCEFINACDKGFLCANPALGTECDAQAIGCCLPFCDTSAPPDCPGVNQTCTPWYEPDTAPPGLENVGICGIPQ